MTYVCICKGMLETPLEFHFIYLGSEEIYHIFKTCCMISVLFSTKYNLFHNCIFFCSNSMFFMNHVLTFKYQPCHLKVNDAFSNSCCVELNDWMTVNNELERVWKEVVGN
jgi:hypothetical protein